MFGATGMIGKPVAEQLIENGHELTVLVLPQSENHAPQGAKVLQGNISDKEDIKKALQGSDGIYISLSVGQSSKEADFQPEREGIKNILDVAESMGNVKVIGYLSSLLQDYQGMNGFDWWVFRIKQRAYQMVKASSVPSLIFKPSSFLQNFTGPLRQGKSIALAGESKYPMYWISAEDYGKMVSSAFLQFDGTSQEYAIQGAEAYTNDEAAKVFVDHYTKEKLKVSKSPLGMLRFMGNFIRKLKYVAKIVEATNNYPEKFHGTYAWEKLGKPQTSVKAFAASH